MNFFLRFWVRMATAKGKHHKRQNRAEHNKRLREEARADAWADSALKRAARAATALDKKRKRRNACVQRCNTAFNRVYKSKRTKEELRAMRKAAYARRRQRALGYDTTGEGAHNLFS